jgi:N utilization substance protein B
MKYRPETRARVLAFQALCQLEAGSSWEDLSSFFAEAEGPVGTQASALAHGAWEGRAELDGVLARHLENWSIPRLGVVERAILRLGLYELLHKGSLPAAVVIDEAVRLAKRFGGDESAALVNAVLDKGKALDHEPTKGR